jgi:ornithine cyclodeaminase
VPDRTRLPGNAEPRVVRLQEIRSALEIPLLIDELAAGFVAYSSGQVVVPPVAHLGFDEPRGDVHIKYGYIQDDDVFVIKIADGFDDNAALGLPPGDGMLLVFDRRTGMTRAILLDRGYLTDLRTAAAGAVAARVLAPRTVERIGVIGTGVQGHLQLELLARVVECRSAMVYGRDAHRAARYVHDMAVHGFEVTIAPDPDTLAAACDLIVTATTARAPLFSAGVVRPGTHISAFGADSPGKQELDPALMGRADVVVVDSLAQTSRHGELAHALQAHEISEEHVHELGAVIGDRSLGRTGDDQITVCDMTGVAVQDIVVAKHVLRQLGAIHDSPSLAGPQ